MVIDLQQKQFKKMLNKIMPSLSLVQNEGISIEEAKEKLMELFIKSKKSPHGHDLEGRLYYISYFFQGWLYFEKKLTEEKASELSSPIYELLNKKLKEIIESKKSGKEVKIMSFPEKIK